MSIIIKELDVIDYDHHHKDSPTFVRTWAMSDTDVTASTRCIEVDGDRFAYRRMPSSPWRSSALPCTATTIIN